MKDMQIGFSAYLHWPREIHKKSIIYCEINRYWSFLYIRLESTIVKGSSW